jgi:prophage regulatory protein
MILPIPANDNVEGVRYLRFPQLKEKKGIHFSRMHIYRLEKQNAFPKRVPVGKNSIAWVESEVDQHMIKQMAAR